MEQQRSPSVKRVLTQPCEPKAPGSLVNRDDDLIVYEGDILDTSSSGIVYRVTGSLGSGTFGQVFECAVIDGGCDARGRAAVKVIKNQSAYYHQARVEIGLLQLLNTQVDPHDHYHIVRLRDFFMYKGHLCLVFELLGLNLYELIRRNKFRGLSLSLVRVFVTHILEALAVLKASSIIHCDIKPENILLQDPKTGRVKLIDFGSACFKKKAVYTYIQSRFYRSPEIIVGYGYTEAVDMWSLGCVAAELFLGLPLFPAASEFDLLERITETIGPLPRSMLINSRNTSVYYTFEDSDVHRNPRLLTLEEFQSVNMKRATKGKQYFKHTLLRDIVQNAPFKAELSEDDKLVQMAQRECFLDFLDGLLHVDPACRMTPREALAHPYITGEKIQRREEQVVPRSSVQEIPQKRPGMRQATTSGGPSTMGGIGTSYTPAGSIHRIQSGASLTMSESLPTETPPSRSLGARMHVAPACSAPMPAPTNGARVMPIMEMPDDLGDSTSSSLNQSIGFVPSSVRTFRSFITKADGLYKGESIEEDVEEREQRSSRSSSSSGGSIGDPDDDSEAIFEESPTSLVQDGMQGLRLDG